MTSLPEEFKHLIASSTLETKRAMLIALSDDIRAAEKATLQKKQLLTEYVTHIPTFIRDKALIEDIKLELSGLNIAGKNSKKIKTAWLNTSNENYRYNGADLNNTHLIEDFPKIKSLMDKLNDSNTVEGHPLNSCLVACYSTSKKSLSVHADDEKEICQLSSICNLTIGMSRTIEFEPKIPYYKGDPVLTFNLEEGSLNVMRPGCQQVLKHRVPPGVHETGADNVRYSLSFRRFLSKDPTQCLLSPVKQHISFFENNQQQQQPQDESLESNLVNTVLFAGDSHFTKLDPTKLGKEKIKVVNISKGGLRIFETEKSISDYFATNTTDNIVKIFISVGSNDIRYCTKGTHHLTKPLKLLSERIKMCFPKAHIFFQSLLPLPINNPHVKNNVLEFNRLLYDTCRSEKIFFFDVFEDFLDYESHRNCRLFNRTNIHLNSYGLGILARKYINKIRGTIFNPRIF